jgi:hypothetical protein
MKTLKKLVADMISKNRSECEHCGKTLFVQGVKFCSPRCEKLYKADARFFEGMKRLPDT